ncbi:L,D-transpeptidase [Chelativorans sp. YIM 93263]|uniref:L,D-transpeptidase n=1 Tax=Chelativorans sp. YIM 93263 TaxID=2906648 RepID=UPI002378A7D7|nr:L,D-transpeptidase [Chelativorans sp. YIM 93263]
MKVIFSAVAILAMLFVPGFVQAQSRYSERPPSLVSPDLAAPWVLQLRRPDTRAQPHYETRQQQIHNRQIHRRQVHRRQVHPVPRQRQRYVGRSVERPPQTSTAAVATRAPSAPAHNMDPKFLPQTVPYDGPHAPGTIVIDTGSRFLYHVMEGGNARRYGVGVGKQGFEWRGTEKITQKREWPDWRPPKEMIERERKKGNILPAHMKGGPENPLGARALYLGSTLYRIHGTNAPWTIGKAVSSGCIRMRNEDVMELYERIPVGAKVVVI